MWWDICSCNMSAIQFHNFDERILVVGPVYDRLDKLEKILNMAPDYGLVIINGNLTFPCDNLDEVQKRIDFIDKHLSKNIIYNMGNYDFNLLIKDIPDKMRKWFDYKSNVVMVHFSGQTMLIVTGGGILPTMTKFSIMNNLETSFIANVEGKPWHQSYGGGYGYIISNNPLTDMPPVFYNFSAQIGNHYSTDVQVYAQEVDKYGLKKTILV
jgi:hypothetical protein